MPLFVGPSSGVQTSVYTGGGATGAFIGVGATTTTGRDAGVGTVTGAIVYNETDGGVQIYSGTAWANIYTEPFSASGGNQADGVEPGNGYKYHTFTSNGAFTVASGSDTVEILVVGGGGGGGTNNDGGTDGGAGGGGGGVATSAVPVQGPGTYNITVGNGGPGGSWPAHGSSTPECAATPQPYGGQQGSNGGDSIFGASSPVSIKLTGEGGGGGGSGPNAGNADCGGSGGGQGSGGGTARNGAAGNQPNQNPQHAGPTLAQYGNPGGNSPSSPEFTGAGGGGAGGAGSNGSSGGPGEGGDGIQLPTAWDASVISYPGNNPYGRRYGSGGSGGRQPNVGSSPVPAPGHGGGQGASSNANAGSGATNGGGGGGGAGAPGPEPSWSGAPGGKGLVVVRYAVQRKL